MQYDNNTLDRLVQEQLGQHSLIILKLQAVIDAQQKELEELRKSLESEED